MISLLVGKPRIWLQILQSDLFQLGQRISRSDKHMRLCQKQPFKFQIMLLEGFSQNVLVELVLSSSTKASTAKE